MKKSIGILVVFIAIVIMSCGQNKKEKTEKTADIKEEKSVRIPDKLAYGKTVAQKTFASLLTELQKGVNKGGYPEAVQYCNLKALPITDSLSRAYGVSIRRVSDLYRNPKNKPTMQEMAVLNEYKKMMNDGQKPYPMIKEVNGKEVFYGPIHIQHMCLACHGDIKDPGVIAKLKKFYPDDHAQGYREGDLRGMWAITFAD